MNPLRRHMIDEMQIRNLAPNTQRAYIEQVSRFARYFSKSPELLGPAEIRMYLLHLVNDKHLAASSIIVAVSALRFLYTITLKRAWVVEDVIPAGKQARKLPVVMSREEVAHFLAAVDNLKHRVILTICYATGLRVSEAVRLTPDAIDSKRMVIRVAQGKGRKDRYVMLPPRLLDLLREYWRRTHPGAWLFPGDRPDQPIGPLAVNHICRQVRASAASQSQWRHILCATRSPFICWRPAPICARIQLLLGHRNLGTTARYLLIATSKVCATASPFESLPSCPANRPGSRTRLTRGFRGPQWAGSGERVPPLRPGFS